MILLINHSVIFIILLLVCNGHLLSSLLQEYGDLRAKTFINIHEDPKKVPLRNNSQNFKISIHLLDIIILNENPLIS